MGLAFTVVTEPRALALVSIGPARTQLIFRLREGTSVVGRDPDCEIILNSETVSRRHAEVDVSDGIVSVRDLGSRNGTYVDGERVSSGTIQIGHRIQFGTFPFELQDIAGDREETARVSARQHEMQRKTRADLTDGQRRVFDLVIEGKTEKEVARRLNLSPNTVHTHVKDIYAVFGVHSRAELIALQLK